MKTSLSGDTLAPVREALAAGDRDFAAAYPGAGPGRQPVHTVYGGAQLFKAETAQRLGAIARRHLGEHLADAADFVALGVPDEHAGTVRQRVGDKLDREPVEDFRIDFEDGFGHRPDAEEDERAVIAAGELARGLAEGTLPPFVGIRIKPLTGATRERAIRTLDLFVTRLAEATEGELPSGFVVTLPKVTGTAEVTALVELFGALESATALADGSLRLEIMVETPQAILAADGTSPLPAIVRAGEGRVVGAHFGVYDYTASSGLTAAYQSMRHPVCDFARLVMQVALADTGVRLSDGATNVLPVGDPETIGRASKLAYDDVRHSLAHGIYQGWDLHPAQLPVRYAAVYSFFLEQREEAGDRLARFLDRAAQATLSGDVFDDAATGRALLNFFASGLACGALTEDEARATGLTLDEIRGGSFRAILADRGLAGEGGTR